MTKITIFSQRDHFRLLSSHHVQKGPAFPHPMDVSIDGSSGEVQVRSTENGKDKVQTKHLDLPPDLANGLILTILKNIRPGTPETKLSSELGLQRCFGALWALVFPHSCNINLSLAVMSSHTSHRTLELAEHLPFSASLEEEIRQLMSWEVDRMWEDRDFLRLTVQRAMLDPKVARFTRLVGPARLAKAIAERLRHYRNKRVLDDDDIEAASNAISALCFVFGFMRPAVLGYHRKETKRVAENVAKIIARGLQ